MPLTEKPVIWLETSNQIIKKLSGVPPLWSTDFLFAPLRTLVSLPCAAGSAGVPDQLDFLSL